MSSSERCSVRPGSTNQRCAASSGWYRARSSPVVRPTRTEPWISPPRSLTQARRKSPPIVNAVLASVPMWKPEVEAQDVRAPGLLVQVDVEGRALRVAGQVVADRLEVRQREHPVDRAAICALSTTSPACRPSVCAHELLVDALRALHGDAREATSAPVAVATAPRARRGTPPPATHNARARHGGPVSRRGRAESRRQRGRTRRSRCRPCR